MRSSRLSKAAAVKSRSILRNKKFAWGFAMKGYEKEPELRLFRRNAFGDVAYSDVDEVKGRIHAIIKNARDRGTFSVELLRGITDWPSEYHLSRQRHCLVRPLGIMPGDKVLEIG